MTKTERTELLSPGQPPIERVATVSTMGDAPSFFPAQQSFMAIVTPKKSFAKPCTPEGLAKIKRLEKARLRAEKQSRLLAASMKKAKMARVAADKDQPDD